MYWLVDIVVAILIFVSATCTAYMRPYNEAGYMVGLVFTGLLIIVLMQRLFGRIK